MYLCGIGRALFSKKNTYKLVSYEYRMNSIFWKFSCFYIDSFKIRYGGKCQVSTVNSFWIAIK